MFQKVTMIGRTDGKQLYDSKENDMEHKLNVYCSLTMQKLCIYFRHKTEPLDLKPLNCSNKQHRAQLFVIEVPEYQIGTFVDLFWQS